jgi:hypothetical protein
MWRLLTWQFWHRYPKGSPKIKRDAKFSTRQIQAKKSGSFSETQRKFPLVAILCPNLLESTAELCALEWKHQE